MDQVVIRPGNPGLDAPGKPYVRPVSKPSPIDNHHVHLQADFPESFYLLLDKSALGRMPRSWVEIRYSEDSHGYLQRTSDCLTRVAIQLCLKFEP